MCMYGLQNSRQNCGGAYPLNCKNGLRPKSELIMQLGLVTKKQIQVWANTYKRVPKTGLKKTSNC